MKWNPLKPSLIAMEKYIIQWDSWYYKGNSFYEETNQVVSLWTPNKNEAKRMIERALPSSQQMSGFLN